jgi:nitrate reductase alpha subunit
MDIEMTATVEYADFGLAANSWAEFETYEITASCSNPFLQMWKGGIPPLYDTRDDARILAEVAAAIGDEIGRPRLRDYWKFIHEGRPEVYIQRLLDYVADHHAATRFEDIASGKYGEPGAALMLFRTYPRIPFWEQVNDSVPFYTDCGRLNSYCDIPEAIEYGENIISHREGPEATPCCPMSSSPAAVYVRPDDYGIPQEAMGWEERTVRNIAMPWDAGKGHQKSALGTGLQLLLHDAQDPPPRPFVVEHGGLDDHPGFQLRRPVPHGQAAARAPATINCT